MHKVIFALSLLSLPLAGCDSSVSASLNYDVELRSLDNMTSVGSGELTFDSTPRRGATVNGNYSLVATTGGPITPLTTTTGVFTASFDGDSLVVTILAPSTSDVGLSLTGDIDAESYTGTWSEITIAGAQLRGVFVGSTD